MFKTILKIGAGLFISVFLLLAGLILALRQPTVQTWSVRQAARILSEKLGHRVTVGQINLQFFRKVVLENVKVLDQRQAELIYVQRAEATISSFSLLNRNQLIIEDLTLIEPRAFLVKYKTADSLNLNVLLAAIKKLIKTDTAAAPGKFDFTINALTVENGRFRYDNQQRTRQPFGVDYQHLDLARISVRISNILLRGDTIGARITDLRAYEQFTNAQLKNLDTRLTYAPTFLEFADLDLRLNASNLRRYLRFDYTRLANFRYFNDSVRVTAQLDSAAVFSDDIALFAPPLKNLHDKILISGALKGKTRRFTAQNLNLYYGRYTHIVGDISADGLPNIKETFADLKLRPSVIAAQDLQKFIPKKSYALAARLGLVKFQGNLLGFYADFVANGSFATALGNVVSDINLKINQNPAKSSYTGYLKTDQFALGKLIGDERTVQNISMRGRVQGTGFNLATARLNLDATIPAVGLRGYTYRNITTDATLSRQLVAGTVSINDPNLRFTARGTFNLSRNSPAFNVKAAIQRADLYALKLVNKKFILQTNADLDFTGLTLDHILGQATFRQTKLTYNQKIINFDSVGIVSKLDAGQRSVLISSNVLDFAATGNFQMSRLLADARAFIREDALGFKSNAAATAAYYQQKPVYTGPDYALDLTLLFKKGNALLQAYFPAVYVAQNTRFTGSFRQGRNTIFTLFSHIDTLAYGNYRFYQNELELNNSKLQNSPEVLASALFTSQSQQLAQLAPTENIYLEGIWADRNIRFAANVAQANSTNKAAVTGDLTFLTDRVQVVFNQSDINVLGKPWQIRPANQITITGAGRAIAVQGLSVFHEAQSIDLTGLVSRNPAERLVVDVNNFRLENLNSLFKQKLRGVLNASVAGSDLLNKPILVSRLTVDSLRLDSLYVGNIDGATDWDNRENKLKVDLGIFRENMRVLSVTGDYNPRAPAEQLNLLAVMDEAPVKLVEPILKTLFSDLSGIMAGRLQISGRLRTPVVVGSVFVTQGRFRVNYLNTYYQFNDRIYFTEKEIAFRNVKIRDTGNNVATITGGIQHEGFQKMALDLSGEFRRFTVLNTTRAENALYYGTAVATGTAKLAGVPANLFITVDARSEAGTKMFIPLDNQAAVKRQSYIRFVNHQARDSIATDSVAAPKIDLAGINLNFNLGITDDAELNIIFDEATGDVVRGSGNGRINLNIDTRGEFTMEGQIEIARGYYNFSLYNIIRKGFDIRPGGTITWNGSPYEAIMDITATYTQRIVLPASISSIGPEGGNNQIRYPVTAVMDLDGRLLAPEIKLDLEFADTPPNLETQINAYLADIRNNQDELNRQVFNLLILRRLSDPTNSGQVAVGAQVDEALGLTSGISQALSNQLGNLISQVDSNLEIDIGLDRISGQQLTDLQLRLSYSLFKGRLRLSHEGGLPGSSGVNARDPNYAQNGGELPGSWRADVYLRNDGKLRLKLEYNIMPYTQFGQTAVSSLRGSVLHTERFDTFAELFARRKLRRRDRQAPQKIIIDSDERVGL